MTKRFDFTLAEGATHVANFSNSGKNAFTLAEVLITLGIIGVVAAMTMPTLLNSTQGAQYRTAYKKALSVLSQAVVLNVALDDYDLSQASKTGTEGEDGTSASVYNLFNNRMNVARVCGGACASSNDRWAANNDADIKFGQAGNYTFFFNDGITLTFETDAVNCTEGNASDGFSDARCLGAIDVNGAKNPNRQVVCDGADGSVSGTDCKVTNPTDIYPIAMYDQSIVPNTDAARAVLFGGK